MAAREIESGHHQCKMRIVNITRMAEFKTVFRIADDHFEFQVMPFGLSNAPSTFHTTINQVLAHFF